MQLWERKIQQTLGKDNLGGKGQREVGWGTLTYSTLDAGTEGLTHEQGCQGGLKKSSCFLHTFHPSRACGLQRQSQSKCFSPILSLGYHPSLQISICRAPLSGLCEFCLTWLCPWMMFMSLLLLSRKEQVFSSWIALKVLGWSEHPCLLPTEFESKCSRKLLLENQKALKKEKTRLWNVIFCFVPFKEPNNEHPFPCSFAHNCHWCPL